MYARAVPPARGIRMTIWSGPREVGAVDPFLAACRSPLQATASVSARRRGETLETRAQRESPVRLASRFIERFRVIPFENREVEQIHTQSHAVASEWVALEIEIIIRRLR